MSSIVGAKAGVAERYLSQLQDLLIPNPENAVDLAMRLQKWWCHKDHYSKLVSSLSQELRTYTWDNMAKSIFKYLQNSG